MINVHVLVSFYNSIWKIEKCPTTSIQSLVITLPKKWNLSLVKTTELSTLSVSSWRYYCRSWFKSMNEYHRASFQSPNGYTRYRPNIQSPNPLWEILGAPIEPVPCLHRFQDSIWHGKAWHIMTTCCKIHHQFQYHMRHWKAVRMSAQWQHMRQVQNYSRGPTSVSALTSPL